MSNAEIVNEAEDIVVGKPTIIRNATDLQKLKLEKLMKNPDKPILLPEKPKERGVPVVPEFVRNVMGSSAGAGSGEFHVYRHLRRKEYARQKYMREKGERERMDDEYHQKLEDNKRKADEKTAKKRAKRLKRKSKQQSGKLNISKSESESEELSDSEQEESKGTDETKTEVEEQKDDIERETKDESMGNEIAYKGDDESNEAVNVEVSHHNKVKEGASESSNDENFNEKEEKRCEM